MNKKAMFSSARSDWETPDEFFKKLDDIYHFVLDAAADAQNHKCPEWLGPGGIHEDALAVSWKPWLERGNIWLNPPYSQYLQKAFVTKARDEILSSIPLDIHNSIVCLLPARTDTRVFHELIWQQPHATVEFIKGRLKFKGAAAPAPFPSMIVEFK